MTDDAATLEAPPERWGHGSTFSRTESGAQRVCGAVARLHLSGKLGDAEMAAAERYYRDAMLALGVSPSLANEPRASATPGDPGHALIVRITARTALRRAREAVGPRMAALLDAAVIGERSARAIAAEMGYDHQHVGGRIAAAVEALTDHYAQADGKAGRAADTGVDSGRQMCNGGSRVGATRVEPPSPGAD